MSWSKANWPGDLWIATLTVERTGHATDYNVNLDGTNLAVEISGNGEQITSGQGETDGTEEVDLVPIG